jgi:hypothetical protein
MATNKASTSVKKKQQEPYIVERPKAAPVVEPKKVALPPIVPQQYRAVVQQAQKPTSPKLPTPTVQKQTPLKSLTAPKPVIPKVVLPHAVSKAATPKVTLPPTVPQMGTTRQGVPATRATKPVFNPFKAIMDMRESNAQKLIERSYRPDVSLPLAFQREMRRGFLGTPLMPGDVGYKESLPGWRKNIDTILEDSAPNIANSGQMLVNEGVRRAYEGTTAIPRILADATARLTGNETARNISNTLNAPIDKLLAYQPTEMAYIQDVERRGDERGPIVGALTRASGAIGAMLPSIMIGDALGASPGLQNIGRAAMALGGSGSSANEAYANGATREQASARGALFGALSYVVDGLAKGIPGLTKYSSLDKLQQNIANKLFAHPVVNLAVQKGINIAGEGLEEVVEQFGDKFIDWATINGFKNLDLGTLDEYLDAGGMGSLVSALLGGGSATQPTATMSGSQAVNPFTSPEARKAFGAQQEAAQQEQGAANEARRAAQQAQNEQISQVQTQAPQRVDIASPEAAVLIDRAKQRVREQISPNGSIRIPNALKAVSPELSQLTPITSVTVNPQDLSTNTSIMGFARRAFESVGFHMNRNGLGDVRMDQSGIANGAAHIKNVGDAAAFAAVADVIRDGVEIFHDPNHKGRRYETRLLAAPITVNGQDAMVGVVVRKTSDNHYYAHRLLTPDGNVIDLSDTNNKQATISPGAPLETERLAAALPAVDIDSLSYANPTVNDTSVENTQVDGRFAAIYRAPLLANSEGRQAVQRIIDASNELQHARVERDALKAEYNRLTERLNPSAIELSDVRDLAEGTIGWTQLRFGSNVGKVKTLLDARIALDEASGRVDALDGEMSSFRDARLAEYHRAAEEVATSSDQWNDHMALTLALNSTERDIQSVVPPGAARDALMARERLATHNDAEIERALNALNEGIRQLNLTRSESEAVQFIGEVRDNIARFEEAIERGAILENNGTERRAITEQDQAEYQANMQALSDYLAAHQGLDMAKIENAIDHFREDYNALLEAMNETLIMIGKKPIPYRRGYFPHFTEDGNDSLLQSIAKQMGFSGNPISEIPTSIAGMTDTFKPTSRYNPHAQQRHGTQTTYDAVRGFERYAFYALDIIYHSDDVRFFRTLEDTLRDKYDGGKTQTEIENVLKDENSSHDDKLQAIEDIKEANNKGLSHLSGFVTWLSDRTNLWAGKQSMYGREAMNSTGRGFIRKVNNVIGRFGSNTMWFNLRSALSNALPLIQNGAEVSPVSLVRGMAETMRNINNDDGFIDRSDFLTSRAGTEALRRSGIDRVRDAGYVPMRIMDTFATQSLVRARHYDNINRGMSEEDAMAEADLWAGRAMVDRSKSAMPTIYSSNNPLHRMLGMFQEEVNNSIQHMLVDLPKEARQRGVAWLAQLFMRRLITEWLFDDTTEKLFGGRPASDFGGNVNKLVGDLTGQRLNNVWDIPSQGLIATQDALPTVEAFKGFGQRTAEGIPFISGVVSEFFGGQNARFPGLSNLPLLNNTGNFEQIVKGLAGEKPLTSITPAIIDEASRLAGVILPFGAGAINRTAQAVGTIGAGGSYRPDKDGNPTLQFPFFRDADQDEAAKDRLEKLGKATQAIFFGKWATPESQQHLNYETKALNAGETAAYQSLLGSGVKDTEAYDVIQTLKAIQPPYKGYYKSDTQLKREYLLNNSTLTPDQKRTIDRAMVSGKDSNVKPDYRSAEHLRISLMDKSPREKLEKIMRAGATAKEAIELYDTLRDAHGYYGFRETVNENGEYSIGDGNLNQKAVLIYSLPMSAKAKEVAAKEFLNTKKTPNFNGSMQDMIDSLGARTTATGMGESHPQRLSYLQSIYPDVTDNDYALIYHVMTGSTDAPQTKAARLQRLVADGYSPQDALTLYTAFTADTNKLPTNSDTPTMDQFSATQKALGRDLTYDLFMQIYDRIKSLETRQQKFSELYAIGMTPEQAYDYYSNVFAVPGEDQMYTTTQYNAARRAFGRDMTTDMFRQIFEYIAYRPEQEQFEMLVRAGMTRDQAATFLAIIN